MNKSLLTLSLAIGVAGSASAQLAKDNSCKFLGNITTSYNWVEYCDFQECSSYKYSDYWNQVTCENATKWGSVNSSSGVFNWTNADRTFNYCKEHGVKFKFHALIWGSQHPTWIESLSVDDTKKAIVAWFDEVKKHYPDLEIIDVVNEAIYSGSDYHSPYKSTKIIEALGKLAEERNGKTYNCSANGYSGNDSYQWIAEAFRLARDRWPNAILIYNDYNTFQWQKTEFINLINALKACGAPIDAAGCQSHDLNDMDGTTFKNALEDIHNKINLPIYITEYDIAKSDDSEQLTRYKQQFPTMWEADYVAGVTLWGWDYGKTWTTDGNSGLVKNCADRSAFTWLKQYMATDAAKNAKGPFCSSGITAKVSLSSDAVSVGSDVTITATATATAGVDHIDMYANDELLVNKYIAPYEWTYTPTEAGDVTIKIVAYDKDGNSDEKTTTLTVCPERAAYNGEIAQLPGTIEAENFDEGCPGDAYYDSDDEDEGDGYRATGVDIVAGNGSYALGYTAANEWTEYTINIKESGEYTVESTVASGSDNSGFHLSLMNNGTEVKLTDKIEVPNGGDWSTYTTVSTEIGQLEKGENVLRLTIDGPYVNIDKLEFKCPKCASSISGIASDGEINIVPNPASDRITVTGVEDAKLTLTDATGRTIAITNGTEMAIPAGCEGIYYLNIQTSNNSIVKKLVIK